MGIVMMSSVETRNGVSSVSETGKQSKGDREGKWGSRIIQARMTPPSNWMD